MQAVIAAAVALAGAILSAVYGAAPIVVRDTSSPAGVTVSIPVTWVQIVDTALAGTVLVFLVIGAGMFLYHAGRHRLSGHLDADWRATAMLLGEVAQFELRLRPGAHPATLVELGRMECRVWKPNGVVVVFDDDHITPRGWASVFVQVVRNCAPGRYEYRWYGSTRRGRFFEITSGVFDLPGDPPIPAREPEQPGSLLQRVLHGGPRNGSRRT
jgi:hypothetical protein